MFQNYFKISFRNLVNNKVYSLINILGLAIGITTCTLITMYLMDETSYDKHFTDGDRVYRVAYEIKGNKWVAASAPMAAGLKKDFAEVEQVTRLLRMPGVDRFLMKNEAEQKRFYENNGYYVDSTFFDIFNYQFKYGNNKTALNEPNSIVLSEQVATKLFGVQDPLNKTVKIILPFGENNYTVKGVLASGREKSHIPAHFFMSMNNNDVGQWVKNQTNWANNNVFHTYVKLTDGSDAATFEKKLDPFMERNAGDVMKALGISKKMFLQPLREIYLHSNHEFEVAPNGNIKYLYIFGSIAAFLLLIACINFMNLSTARSEKRAREVGVRKVIGAVKSALIAQFLGESLMLSFLALVISCIFIQLLTPVFNQVTGKDLSFLNHPEIFVWLVVLTLLTGFLSGIYPAFYLSSFTPVLALKGRLRNSFSAVLIRKGLVVFQFTISVVLILGAILIGRQMNYMSSQNLGFNKSQKIILPLQSAESAKNYKILKDDLSDNAQVVSSAKGSTYPGVENIQDMLFYGEEKSVKENVDMMTAYIESDYLKTLGIKVVQGRGFSNEFTADTNSLVLNETAVKKLGYTVANAIGKKVYYEFNGKKIAMDIIGVVKNYHFQSLQQDIKPLALTISPFFGGASNFLIVDVKSSHYEKLLGEIEISWKKINPDSPFEFSFLDKDFQKNYEKEERTSSLIRYFALIGVFIACLGLFGLATFTAEQRTKEIGIRKVLGASVFGITALLSRDFLELVVISILVASPIAWYAMNQWLSGFAFKTEISWQIFFIAGAISVVISLLTIGYQTVKAALMNPIKSLKSD